MSGVIRCVYPTMLKLPESQSELVGLYESCFVEKKCILIIVNLGTVEQLIAMLPHSALGTS